MTGSTERRRTRDYVTPVGSATRCRLVLAHGTPDLHVVADPSLKDLVRASFSGRLPEVSATGGKVVVSYPARGPAGWRFLRRARGDIALNAGVPWTLELIGGVHRLHADFRSLTLEGTAIRGGVNHAELWLPPPRGTVPFELAGGINNVSIHRPDGIPLGLSVRGGISSLRLDAENFGSFGRGILRETGGWSEATDRLTVTIAGGVNHLIVTSDDQPTPENGGGEGTCP
jgi:hypothetical protein